MKIDPYNFELYRFKVGAFLRQCVCVCWLGGNPQAYVPVMGGGGPMKRMLPVPGDDDTPPPPHAQHANAVCLLFSSKRNMLMPRT